jgi:hypothetical protein
MQLPRMTTLRWMVAVAAAEAVFTVMYWLCCDSELWGYIVLGSVLPRWEGQARISRRRSGLTRAAADPARRGSRKQ